MHMHKKAYHHKLLGFIPRVGNLGVHHQLHIVQRIVPEKRKLHAMKHSGLRLGRRRLGAFQNDLIVHLQQQLPPQLLERSVAVDGQHRHRGNVRRTSL